MVFFFFRVALFKCGHNQFQNFFVYLNSPQSIAKRSVQFLFANITFRALAFVTGAVIVDVTALFDFSSQRTTAMTTRKKALERPVVFLLAGSPPALFSQNLLYTVKEFPGNDRLMISFITSSCPIKITISKDSSIPNYWKSIKAKGKRHIDACVLFAIIFSPSGNRM